MGCLSYILILELKEYYMVRFQIYNCECWLYAGVYVLRYNYQMLAFKSYNSHVCVIYVL